MKIKCHFEQFKMYLKTLEYVNDIKENTDYSKC